MQELIECDILELFELINLKIEGNKYTLNDTTYDGIVK